MTVRRVHLLSLVFAVLAPHVAGQGIRLPYQLPELEQRAQRDSNDAAVQYMLALGKADAARTAFQRFLAMAPTRDSAEIAEVQRYIVMLH